MGDSKDVGEMSDKLTDLVVTNKKLSVNDFETLQIIGRGAFGEVRVCKRKGTAAARYNNTATSTYVLFFIESNITLQSICCSITDTYLQTQPKYMP